MASYVITKSMAENAARALTREKFDDMERQWREKECSYGDFLMRKYFPQEVLEVVEKYADYVGYNTYFYVKVHTRPSRIIDTSIKVPLMHSDIVVTEEEYVTVVKFRKEWDDLKEKRLGYCKTITEEILKLRTYNHVKEQVPELLPFLPKEKEEKNLPAVNFSDFRTLIKSIVKQK